MKRLLFLIFIGLAQTIQAQRELYRHHFDLSEVELTGGPMLSAMKKNCQVLLQYDVDRLLTPYVRQAGLSSTSDTSNKYYHWLTKHPNFENWGGGNFDLSGHVGGHYLSALALAYAACADEEVKAELKQRMDYMLGVMKDCQDQFDMNTTGLYGFIGGQPINDVWEQLYQGKTDAIRGVWGWVPFYCQHKILAGLRDAYIYGKSDAAREMFRKLSDWSVNVVCRVSASDFEDFLNCEHGGMNESMLDAYQLFGDEKYLTAAKKYTHKVMLNGMQTLSTTFLDGKHANTQVPKYIGMERIGETGGLDAYLKAAENFWQDVAQNRTVCIGGNSVSEHFLAKSNANRYIDVLDGPESCNSNNMLKLTEMMADRTGDAKYVDFYEQTMWNHILSTQDPTTGGYVYFTTLRPQSYRIYSQVNQGMWCCVGTGMENHSKYGHFIYTHDGAETLYVNLFTPSRLVSDEFVVTQETRFPDEEQTTLIIGKAGSFALSVRHPSWVGDGFSVKVNGKDVDITTVAQGVASYVTVSRTWAEGDVVTVSLPMSLRYEECPGYSDYIAFKYGPILLAAQTSTSNAEEAVEQALSYEASIQNEYGGEGRMDHAPGSRANSKNLTSAPLLIGDRADVLKHITRKEGIDKLCFTIDVHREGVETYKWKTLTLQPFYQIHHARYQCYWYQQTPENYANSTMAKTEAENEALLGRTLDFVAPGEQQSEAGHESQHSLDSSTGDYNAERYRDSRANGYIQYTLYNEPQVADSLSLMLRFNLADRGRMATLMVDGTLIANITIPASAKGSDSNGFYNVEYPIPAVLIRNADGEVKRQFVVRLTASSSTLCPGIYYLRLLRRYDNHAYVFHASDWITGDAGRVPASSITYDEEQNIIEVKASGANNVCLMLKYDETNYTIAPEQTYLVVRGTNLKTTSGASYLWWLNGTNHASSVLPNVSKTIRVNGKAQQVIAWDMTKSGLYENFSGDRPSVCVGKTIFGLTSTMGKSSIYDISFTDDMNTYIDTATSMETHLEVPVSQGTSIYDLQGRRIQGKPYKGVSVQNGKKYLN